MKEFKAERIKNIAVVGHSGSGKTSLAEAMLHLAHVGDRLGKTSDGSSIMDFDPEEKRRGASISTAVCALEWMDTKINLIDTPGLFDFAGGMCEGLRACETALIVLSGKSGVTVGASKAFKAATALGRSKIFYVNKLDSENSDFDKVLANLNEQFGACICPVIIPHMEGRKVDCYVNLLSGKAFTYKDGVSSECHLPEMDGRFEELYGMLCESVASVDEDLLEEYLNGQTFTTEELIKGIREGMESGDIAPVLCGSGLHCESVDGLLDGLAEFAPPAGSLCETADLPDGTTKKLPADRTGPTCAIVFKTIADPFVGKLSFFKVVSGKISPDSHLINARTGAVQRISKVLTIQGGKQEDASSIVAGDIGGVAKLSDVITGDTLCDASTKMTLAGVDFPAPTLSMAVYPVNKGDEEKIATGLVRLMEEDPTLRYAQSHETHEMVVSGLGEQHLDVIASRLKAKFGVSVKLTIPKVAYRETIRKKAKVQGRHKKQSGGHGQFGDVWIEFEPCEGEELVFAEKVVGGSVPRNFFPAVEKGLHECMAKGILAGFPVVGIRATLVDGSHHPVDSSEMAFKTAAHAAFRAGMDAATSVLLEPIGLLKASVPADLMGDIISEINKRRGRVLGMNPAEEAGYEEVDADVPMAEMGNFSVVMRSITGGRGGFTLQPERYEEAPPLVAKQVIESAREEALAE